MQETQETQVRSLGWDDPLEKEMATRSNIPTWKIAWTEELDGLRSMGSQSGTTEHAHTHTFLGACVPFKAIKLQTDNLCR